MVKERKKKYQLDWLCLMEIHNAHIWWWKIKKHTTRVVNKCVPFNLCYTLWSQFVVFFSFSFFFIQPNNYLWMHRHVLNTHEHKQFKFYFFIFYCYCWVSFRSMSFHSCIQYEHKKKKQKQNKIIFRQTNP